MNAQNMLSSLSDKANELTKQSCILVKYNKIYAFFVCVISHMLCLSLFEYGVFFFNICILLGTELHRKTSQTSQPVLTLKMAGENYLNREVMNKCAILYLL